MYTFFFVLHLIVVIALIAVILIQRGRSGGLIEALGGVESLFGTKTSSFFVKATVILAILFFITSISLAYLSKERGRSVMKNYFSDTEVQDEEVPGENSLKKETEPSDQVPVDVEAQTPLSPEAPAP